MFKLLAVKLIYGLTVSVAAVLSAWSPTTAAIQPAAIQRSMVLIYIHSSARVEDPTGIFPSREVSVLSSCSGLFVDTIGHVLTVRHCVDEDSVKQDIVERFAADLGFDLLTQDDLDAVEANLKITGLTESVKVVQPDDNGTDGLTITDQTPADIVNAKPSNGTDAALLVVNGLKGATRAMPIASEPLRVDQPIISVGFPALLDGKIRPPFEYARGTVSALPGPDTNGMTTVSAPMWHGSSGGPCINEKGEVIGLSKQVASTGATSFYFITTQNDIREFLDENHILSSAPAAPDPTIQVVAWVVIGYATLALGTWILVLGFLANRKKRRRVHS